MLTFIFFLCSDTITIRKLFVPGTKTAFAVFFLILSIAQVATSSLLIHGARKVAAEEDKLLINFDRFARETQSDYAMDHCDHDQPDPKSDRNGRSDPPGTGGVTKHQPPV